MHFTTVIYRTNSPLGTESAPGVQFFKSAPVSDIRCTLAFVAFSLFGQTTKCTGCHALGSRLSRYPVHFTTVIYRTSSPLGTQSAPVSDIRCTLAFVAFSLFGQTTKCTGCHALGSRLSRYPVHFTTVIYRTSSPLGTQSEPVHFCA